MKTTLSLFVLLWGFPVLGQANDFPTQARVEFVLRCMDEHGGQSYDTLYPCVCSIDKIAAEFSYDEYVRAEVYAMLRRTPGERGGMFRDPDEAGTLADKFVAVTEEAEGSCFVKHIAAPKEAAAR